MAAAAAYAAAGYSTYVALAELPEGGGVAAAGVGGGLVRGTRASDEKIQVRWRLRML